MKRADFFSFFLSIIIVINLLIRAFYFRSFFFFLLKMRDRKGNLFLDFWTFGDKNKYLRIEYFIYGKMGFEYLDHRRVDILISLEILLVHSLSIFN